MKCARECVLYLRFERHYINYGKLKPAICGNGCLVFCQTYKVCASSTIISVQALQHICAAADLFDNPRLGTEQCLQLCLWGDDFFHMVSGVQSARVSRKPTPLGSITTGMKLFCCDVYFSW